MFFFILPCFSGVIYFPVLLLRNQDPRSNNTQKCMRFKFVTQKIMSNRVTILWRYIMWRWQKMTLRVTVLSHVWFSEYCYPENLAYPSNDTWLTLIFRVLLLRKYFPCKNYENNIFNAPEPLYIYFTDSDTFSQYPCIKACLEGGWVGATIYYLLCTLSCRTRVGFSPFSET